MNVRPATLIDCLVVAVTLGEDECREFTEFTGIPFSADELVRMLSMRSGTVAAVQPSGAVAVGGCVPQRRGVARAWLLANPKVWQADGAELTAAVNAYINAQFTEHELHRIEILSLSSRKRAHAWYERALGFKREAVFKRFGVSGENATLHVRLKDV